MKKKINYEEHILQVIQKIKYLLVKQFDLKSNNIKNKCYYCNNWVKEFKKLILLKNKKEGPLGLKKWNN